MSNIVPFGFGSRVGAPVPRYVRYQLKQVRARSLATQERLATPEALMTVASNGLARQALVHEPLIKLAPRLVRRTSQQRSCSSCRQVRRAYETPAELRQGHVQLARQIIECVCDIWTTIEILALAAGFMKLLHIFKAGAAAHRERHASWVRNLRTGTLLRVAAFDTEQAMWVAALNFLRRERGEHKWTTRCG